MVNNIQDEIEILETGLDAIDHIILNQRSLNLKLYIEESYTDLRNACCHACIQFEAIELQLERLKFDKKYHFDIYQLFMALKNPIKNHRKLVEDYYNLRHPLYRAHYYLKAQDLYNFTMNDMLDKQLIATFRDYSKSLILKDDLQAIKKGILTAILERKCHVAS